MDLYNSTASATAHQFSYLTTANNSPGLAAAAAKCSSVVALVATRHLALPVRSAAFSDTVRHRCFISSLAMAVGEPQCLLRYELRIPWLQVGRRTIFGHTAVPIPDAQRA